MPTLGLSRSRFAILASLILVSLVVLVQAGPGPVVSQEVTEEGAGKQQVLTAYGNLPLSFEVNQGQADRQVKFLSRGSGYTLFLTPTEAVLTLQNLSSASVTPSEVEGSASSLSPTVLRMQLIMKLIGANPCPEVSGLEELPGKSHYLIGNDPDGWYTNVPIYARVKYENVYPGIDLIYHGRHGRLEYDFLVSPGADHETIRLAFEGTDDLTIDLAGNLVARLAGGELTHHAPVVYQETDSGREAIAGGYVLDGENRVRFRLAAYDSTRSLVIDPVLSYATYLGGSGGDFNFGGVAVDGDGNVYLAGRTRSVNFPTADPIQGALAGNADVFVAKIDASGSVLVYSTYLGGSGFDVGRGIAVDPSGNVYVTGMTRSGDFPTAGPLDPTLDGPTDAFVTKLNPAGSALVYSTYLGGSSNDGGGFTGIAVDSGGQAYVTGNTNSVDFPVTGGAAQVTFGGGPRDAFVAKLNGAGSALAYATYLGGSGRDGGFIGGQIGGIAIDSYGNAYVTGATTSTNFPTASPLQPVFGGGLSDAFVAKLNAAGSTFVYSTYLGGSFLDEARGIAVDTHGNAYVSGRTHSNDFPTVNPLQPILGGFIEFGFGEDAFVAKLNAAGSGLVYSTYLGGSNGFEFGFDIAVDIYGNAHVAGHTTSSDFPTANPIQGSLAGSVDNFVSKLNAAGSDLLYSTYLGGEGSERSFFGAIAVDALGNAYVAGSTRSDDFPTTTGSVQPVFGGGSFDAFVVKLVLTPAEALLTIQIGLQAIVGG